MNNDSMFMLSSRTAPHKVHRTHIVDIILRRRTDALVKGVYYLTCDLNGRGTRADSSTRVVHSEGVIATHDRKVVLRTDCRPHEYEMYP